MEQHSAASSFPKCHSAFLLSTPANNILSLSLSQPQSSDPTKKKTEKLHAPLRLRYKYQTRSSGGWPLPKLDDLHQILYWIESAAQLWASYIVSRFISLILHVRSLDQGENCKRVWRQMRRIPRGEKKVYLNLSHKQAASSARWDGDSQTLSFCKSWYSCAHHSVFGTSATRPTTAQMTIKTWCQPRNSCCSSDMKFQNPISKSSTPNLGNLWSGSPNLQRRKNCVGVLKRKKGRERENFLWIVGRRRRRRTWAHHSMRNKFVWICYSEFCVCYLRVKTHTHTHTHTKGKTLNGLTPNCASQSNPTKSRNLWNLRFQV
jgi:hypothetical protein